MSRAENYKHEMWMIEFKSSFLKELIDCFAQHEVTTTFNSEKDLWIILHDRVDPMFVQPLSELFTTLKGFPYKECSTEEPSHPKQYGSITLQCKAI